MRSIDRKNNMKKANLLAESRYLAEKGITNEGMYDKKGNFEGGTDPKEDNDPFEPSEEDENPKKPKQKIVADPVEPDTKD